MRERLSELISQVQYMGGLEGKLADHLIANGVIVISCGVGDTVYQTDGISVYELEVFYVSLRKGKPYYETESIDFDDDAIGKTVFLTREEAEKALEKMKGGAE